MERNTASVRAADEQLDALLGHRGAATVSLLFALSDGAKRFGVLRSQMGRMSQKTLVAELRALEQLGAVERIVFAEIPPRVEYSLTAAGEELVPLLRAVETANILFPDAKHTFTVHDLREAGFGKFENKPVKELVHDEDFKKWITPGSGYVPEGAEPTDQFHARCAESLMKLFEYMIRMDVTEAACVTHGGVIMSMLSQRAVPTRRPEQWMADPGCGYTVQTDVQLWMRDRLVEAIDIVPFGYADTLRGQAETEENEAFE